MKTKNLLLLFLLSVGMTGFAETKIVNSVGNAFSPMHLVIAAGDVVDFQLAGDHNAKEVSQATYNVNGSAGLLDGFVVNFGGGILSGLSVGTHWYICEAHIGMGMKGTITVTPLGVNDYQLVKSFTVFPNPATDFVNIRSIDNSFGLPYRLMDELGRGVFMGMLNEITTIDLTQFTSGVYFLQVGDERRATFKLIKN